jgi:NADPH:quinone reductase-like Zn-dependent oxidoreductase
MKAAVMYTKGEMPQYMDFPEPEVQGEGQVLIRVKAAAIKHFDKKRASGKHYSTENKTHKPTVIGGDGVGLTADGTRVFAMGVTGMMAEKAIVHKDRMIPLPNGINDAVAAALPNAVAGSALALRFRAGMKPGETVLINGATGFTGKIAVQIAKQYGAKKIIVTGRNEKTLQELLKLGADEMISLKQDSLDFIAQVKAIHTSTPIDVIIDYLWGYTAEWLLEALKGDGSFGHPVRFVTVGSMAGEQVQLSSGILRSSDIQLSGSGLGSWSREEVKYLFAEILPEMFVRAADGKLKVDTESVPLAGIAKLWNMDVPDGKRLVVVM